MVEEVENLWVSGTAAVRTGISFASRWLAPGRLVSRRQEATFEQIGLKDGWLRGGWPQRCLALRGLEEAGFEKTGHEKVGLEKDGLDEAGFFLHVVFTHDVDNCGRRLTRKHCCHSALRSGLAVSRRRPPRTEPKVRARLVPSGKFGFSF